ncbi:hypothetical protein ACEPAI_4526 [Sanghuangporus weigelae]
MSLTDSANGLSLQDALKLLTQVAEDLRTYEMVSVILPIALLVSQTELSSVAAVTCMLYDILLTIEHCRFEAYLGIWATLVFLIPLQIVVILRVIAIWDRKRIIVILLWFSLFATDIVILVTLARIMHIFTYSMNDLLRPVLGCQSGVTALNPTTTIPAWAGVIAFDTVLFVLTLTKALHSYKVARTRLLTILIRDGFAYYSIMLVLGISNLLFLSALPRERGGLASSLTPVLRCSYSIIGSRIILNLRSAASSRVKHDSPHQGIRLVDLSGTSSSSSRSRQASCTEAFAHMPESIQAPVNDLHNLKLGPTSQTSGSSTWIKGPSMNV